MPSDDGQGRRHPHGRHRTPRQLASGGVFCGALAWLEFSVRPVPPWAATVFAVGFLAVLIIDRLWPQESDDRLALLQNVWPFSKNPLPDKTEGEKEDRGQKS